MPARLATFFYGAALVTLPWAGMGLLKLATGREWTGGLQPSWLFLALAVVCAAIDRVRHGSLPGRANPRLSAHQRRWWLAGTVAVLVGVLGSVAGLWLAPSGEGTADTVGRFGKQFIQLAIMAVFTIWPAFWTRGSRRWIWTIRLLLIGGLLQVAYGVAQGLDYYLALPGFAGLDAVFTSNPAILSGSEELYLGDSFQHVPRLRGTNCEPLYLGNYLLFLWPFLVVPVWSVRTRRLVGGAFLLLLLWTWSRGAWLGFAGQVVLAGVLVHRRGRITGLDPLRFGARKYKVAVTVAVAVTAALLLLGWVAGWEGLLFPYRRLAQTFSGQDWSNLTRLYSMQAAWRAFLLSPVFGIGWGQFGWHFPALVDPMGLQSQFSWPVVSNFPLLVLCETGLIGFLVFVGWVVGLGRAVRSRWAVLAESGSPDESGFPAGSILFAATVSVAGVWLQLLTFSQYNLPHIWVSLGLLLAILADRNQGQSPQDRTGQGGSLP